MTDFEEQERQGEISALARMVHYAGGVAGELDTPQVTSPMKASQAALPSVLKGKFPMLSRAHLHGLVGDTHGHC
ncbi:hypothetical protein RHSP_79331 [Rhizobium freirei PRF 81]|uniref:Uncharacterized protein n=1 Tax=Rhizobium freirei PRF 81 TaxID=363754 RepID=N6U191_9HYPH|nr:hypothetical protein [Rhizobium freirei]ENN86424.1 hypothetical protein RHSP_79331 [Rhizobium freirei PRF 81]